jgi:hypothetical protein
MVLGANDFTVNNTATGGFSVSGSPSNMVVADDAGQLRKAFASGATSALIFPVGDMSGGTNDYSPFNITFATNSIPRILGIRVIDAAHPQNGAQSDFVSRYWSFTDNAGGTYSYSTSTFTYSSLAPSDLSGAAANVKVNRWDGSNWTQLVSSVSGNNVSTSGTFSQTIGNL